MKTAIVAVGRLKPGPERALYEEFAKRLTPRPKLIEVEARGGSAKGGGADRMKREGEKLLAALPDKAVVVALDRTGETVASEGLAKRLAAWARTGRPHLAFVIGGADGLSPAVLKRADARLSFGPMTWPHALARAMLAEQLYRAQCIQTGHPYHK